MIVFIDKGDLPKFDRKISIDNTFIKYASLLYLNMIILYNATSDWF